MILKTAEISIDKKTQDSILKNWNHNEDEYFDEEVLDHINRLEIILRVPYKGQGGNRHHMLISSRIEMKERKNGIALVMYCNLLKPLVLSLILGGALSLVGIAFGMFAFLLTLAAVTVITFTTLSSNIYLKSSEYLKELKAKHQ